MQRKKMNYQKALRDVAKSMVRLKRPERLLKMITRFIDREFGLLHTSILILEEKRQHFIFIDSKGSRKFPIRLLKFEVNHPLARWFQKNKKKRHSEDYLSRPLVRKWCANGYWKAGGKELLEELETVQKVMLDLKVELVVPGYYKGNLLGLLFLGPKMSARPFTDSEISFFQILAQDCSMAIKTAQYHQSLLEQNQALARKVEEIERLRKKEQDTYYQIMRSLAQEVYAKDAYTFGHVNQVERLGLMTAREMGYDLSGKRRDVLLAALILHDVGKIGIPDHILNKPDRLTPEEWVIMKTHVDKGAKILEPLTDFKEVAEIIRCHHENFNGTGYPRGLK
ncbi:MAG: HD-GYP domain-containing protein, partial [Thermodesulfobacteriota bacterium]